MSSVQRILKDHIRLPTPIPTSIWGWDNNGLLLPVQYTFDKATGTLDVALIDGFTTSTEVVEIQFTYLRNISGTNLIQGLGANFKELIINKYGADAGTVSIYEAGVVSHANVQIPNIKTSQVANESTTPYAYETAYGSAEGNYLQTYIFSKPLVLTYKKMGVVYYLSLNTNLNESL